MRHLLFVFATAAAASLLTGPVMSQGESGDRLQTAVTAWCAARAAGMNPDQARWAALNTQVSNTSGGISKNIARVITGRNTTKDFLKSLTINQCPEYLGVSKGAQPTFQNVLDDPRHPSFCNWNPWASECKGPKEKAIFPFTKSCSTAIAAHECSYQKYLSANPNIENWAKANRVIAKKDAIRLGAIDAEEFLSAYKEASTNKGKKLNIKNTERKCMKAADYKGCMEYNLKN